METGKTILLIVTFLFIISVFSASIFSLLFIQVVYADNNGISRVFTDYDCLELTAGVERRIGRYVTYHYEFIE